MALFINYLLIIYQLFINYLSIIYYPKIIYFIHTCVCNIWLNISNVVDSSSPDPKPFKQWPVDSEIFVKLVNKETAEKQGRQNGF